MDNNEFFELLYRYLKAKNITNIYLDPSYHSIDHNIFDMLKNNVIANFKIEVKDQTFSEVSFSIQNFSPDLLGISQALYNYIYVRNKIIIPIQESYRIPIGLFLDDKGSPICFDSLLIDPDFYEGIEWFKIRAKNVQGLDIFSNFLNTNGINKKIGKKLNFSFERMIKETDIFEIWETSYPDIPPIMIHSHDGFLEIEINQFSVGPLIPTRYAYFTKFLIDFHFKRILKSFETLLEIYALFTSKIGSQINLNQYPIDPYLNGPETFICQKCNSITLPNSIIKKDSDSNILYYHSKCQYCGSTSVCVSSISDIKMVNAASELFWVCPFDLSSLKVMKSKKIDEKFQVQLSCQKCGKKIKKEYDSQIIRTSSKFILSRGKKSPNIEIIPGTKFVKYLLSNERKSIPSFRSNFKGEILKYQRKKIRIPETYNYSRK